MADPYDITAFDLQAPARLLMPHPHKRQNFRSQVVDLGDGAVLGVSSWDRCVPGCSGLSGLHGHGAGRVVKLSVPCDNLPHCQSCECGTAHEFVLTDEQVAALKGILS